VYHLNDTVDGILTLNYTCQFADTFTNLISGDGDVSRPAEAILKHGLTTVMAVN
jgi:hypothetical protein